MTVNTRRLAIDLSCHSIDTSGNFSSVGSQKLFEGRLTLDGRGTICQRILIGRVERMKDALRLRC